ncbi:ESPR-type extended signal peptide-containing protein, partial [Glaesserella parasuis]|nr:ESPR-type extended signal peptide-containing protein [Glaesserella parasuis]
MNKIFRIIWSHAQQAWVVVSELVKSHTKTSAYTDKRAQVCTSDYFLDKQQDKFKLSLLSLVLLGIFFSPPVGSAEYVVGGASIGSRGYNGDSIGIGREARVGPGSIAIGAISKAESTTAVAIGFDTQATHSDATAVGARSRAAYRSAAYGHHAQALGERSVAVGENAVINAGAARATAIGHNSIVTVAGGVALGYGSRAETAGNVDGERQLHSVTTESTVDNGFKSTENIDGNAIGAVSVGVGTGNKLIKRQITNVAAGTQLTDAVNVAQLKSLTMKITGDTGNSSNEKVGIWEGTLKVLGTNGEIKTSANGDTITLKLDETLKKKITDSASTEYVDNKFNNVKVTGGGQEFTVGDGGTSISKIEVNTEQDKKHFDIVGKDGITTSVNNRKVEVALSNETKTKIDKIDDLETKVNTQGITFKGNTGQTDSIKLGNMLKVEGVNDETEVTASNDKLALGLAEKVKKEIASKMSSFKIKANSEADEETISNDNTIVFKNGKNINVTRSNKELTFVTVATPEFTSVQYGNNGPKITSIGNNLKVTGADGNTPVKITNVAEGTEANDAVNKGQLDNATVTYFHTNTGEQNQGNGDENTNKGKITDKAGAKGKHSITAGVNAKAVGEKAIAIGYNANALGERSVAVGESAMINVGAARATAIGHNSIVSVGGGVALGYGSRAETRGDIEGAKQSYSVTTASSVDNGFKSTKNVDGNEIGAVSVGVGSGKLIKRQITNVAAGKELTDAVNVAQLQSLTMKIEGNENKHNGANADLNSADRPKVGLWSGTLKVVGTNGEIKTSASGDTITLKLDETLKNKITNLDSKVTNQGITFKGDDNGVGVTKKLGDTLKIEGGDNITTKAEGDKVTVNLDKTVDLSSTGYVKFGDNNAKLDKDGLTVKTSTAPDAKTIEVTKDGIKAGDKKIKDVAAGEVNNNSKEAVTGSQLHNFIKVNNDAVAKDGVVKFIDGTGTTVEKTNNGEIKVNVNTGTSTVGVDGKAKPTSDNDNNKIATVKNITDTINDIFWNVISGVEGLGKQADGNQAQTANVKASNTVTFKAGDNLIIKQDGTGNRDFTYSLNSALKNINSIANGVEGTGTKITLSSTSKEVNVGEAKISNVANGDVSANSKEATTGSQLYNLVKINGTSAVNDKDGNLNKGGINFADSSTVTIAKGDDGNVTMAVRNVALTVSDNGNNKGKVTIPNTDADKAKFVNAGDLADTLNKMGFNVESGGNLATGNADGKQLIKAGDTVTFKAGDGLTVKREGNTFTYALGSTLTTDKFTAGEKGENGKEGKDGTIGVNGKDGSSVVINGKDGSIGLNGTNGENGVTIKGGQGSAGVDGADGTTKTRIVYEYKDPNTNEMVTEKIATLNDGQRYSGDNYAENKAETVIKKKLNERLEIKGGATEVSTNNNIGVIAENGVLNVRLAKNIDLGADGSVTTGNTKVDNNGITIKKPANAGDGKSDVKLTANGLDNGGNKIINVAAGVADTDAVNVKQLKDTVNAVATAVATEVVSNDGSVNVMGEVDATTGKNTYDLSVKTSGLTSSPDKKTVNADVAGKAFATAETVANAINTTTAAARTEVTDGRNTQVVATTGENGQDIYNV